MSIIIIAPSFFGYAEKIKLSLMAKGHTVFFFEDKPSVNFWGKAFTRVFPRVMEKTAYIYFRNIANNISDANVSEVLVIKGEALSVAAIKMLRKKFPSATFRLYFWDSYKNMPTSSFEKVGLFDYAFSFDQNDVKLDPRLSYRPLFYVDDYLNVKKSGDFDADLLFIGTDHTDRFKVLHKISNALPPGARFKKLIYCQSKILFFVRKITNIDYRDASADDFIYVPLSAKEIVSLVGRVKAIVDIERSIQSGFTMRTLEMLATSTKIITTNSSLKDADFYSSNNILIIDRNNPVINESFLVEPWVDIDKSVIQSYALSSWIAEVFATSETVQ